LAPYTRLSTLEIYFLKSSGIPLLSTLPRILRTVSALTIRQLLIKAVIPSVATFDLVPWAEIADVLLIHPSFKSTKPLRLTLVSLNRHLNRGLTHEVYRDRFREIMRRELASSDQDIFCLV